MGVGGNDVNGGLWDPSWVRSKVRKKKKTNLKSVLVGPSGTRELLVWRCMVRKEEVGLTLRW